MNAKSLPSCEDLLKIDQLKAALLASEAINHALIRIIDSYVSQTGYEFREKMLLPIRRKLRLSLDRTVEQRNGQRGDFNCDDVAFESAFKLAMTSTERALGL